MASYATTGAPLADTLLPSCLENTYMHTTFIHSDTHTPHIYTHTHTHTHTHAHKHAHACIHARTHARTQTRTHARTHAHTHALTHTHILALTLICKLTHTYFQLCCIFENQSNKITAGMPDQLLICFPVYADLNW